MENISRGSAFGDYPHRGVDAGCHSFKPTEYCIRVRYRLPLPHLKVPKCEIFDRSDFHYIYTIRLFWVDDFVVKILTY